MPEEKAIHTSKWDSCVKKVKEKGVGDPYAICSASIKDAGVKKSHQRRSKKGYYANRKKNENVLSFQNFINEDSRYSGNPNEFTINTIQKIFKYTNLDTINDADAEELKYNLEQIHNIILKNFPDIVENM
jgi:hypothetical protein